MVPIPVCGLCGNLFSCCFQAGFPPPSCSFYYGHFILFPQNTFKELTEMIVISKLMNVGGTQLGACVISAIQSCLTLCDPIDSLPGSSVHGIFQARILGCVAIPSSEDLPDPGSKPTSPVSPEFAGCGFFTTEPPGKPRNWLQWDYVLVVFLGDDFCLIL